MLGYQLCSPCISGLWWLLGLRTFNDKSEGHSKICFRILGRTEFIIWHSKTVSFLLASFILNTDTCLRDTQILYFYYNTTILSLRTQYRCLLKQYFHFKYTTDVCLSHTFTTDVCLSDTFTTDTIQMFA